MKTAIDQEKTREKIVADIAIKQICLGTAKAIIAGTEQTMIGMSAYDSSSIANTVKSAVTATVIKQGLGAMASMFTDADINNLIDATKAIIDEYYGRIASNSVTQPFTCSYVATPAVSYEQVNG